jgi:hypothetical protein
MYIVDIVIIDVKIIGVGIKPVCGYLNLEIIYWEDKLVKISHI